MSDLQQLIEFGFDEKKAKRALRKTRNAGLQPALDYLADHENSDGEDSDAADDAGDAAGPSIPQPSGEAKSLKCLDCGKVFRTVDEASYHGDKSGHANFEESTEEKKALTEEEKKAKLAELREKAAARKAEKSVLDAAEQKRNEEIRRKGGKELGQIKEELRLKEAQKEAEQRKKDKIADAQARARIKAQIEADKKEKAEKFAREKALREGREPPQTAASQGGPKPPAVTASSAGSDKKETRLQIRLPTGNPLVTTRKSDDTLEQVVAWVREQPSGASIEGKVSITFPRKMFTPEEMSKTLQELGLVPSSVLIVN